MFIPLLCVFTIVMELIIHISLEIPKTRYLYSDKDITSR